MNLKKAAWILVSVGVITTVFVVGGFYLYDRNSKKLPISIEPVGMVFYSNEAAGIYLKYFKDLGLVCFEKSCWKLSDVPDEIKAHYNPEMLAKIAPPPIVPNVTEDVRAEKPPEEEDNIEIDQNGNPIL